MKKDLLFSFYFLNFVESVTKNGENQELLTNETLRGFIDLTRDNIHHGSIYFKGKSLTVL